MDKFYLVKAVLCPQTQLLHAYLADNEVGWELNALHQCLQGEKRLFRVAELYKASCPGGRFRNFLVEVRRRLADPFLWAHLAQTEETAADIAIASLRAASICYELVVKRTLAFPYRIFAVLLEPGEATAICRIHQTTPCMLDPLSKTILEKFPSPQELQSGEARLLLEAMALTIMGNTFDVERLHSRNSRRSVQRTTHAPALHQLAVFHQAETHSQVLAKVPSESEIKLVWVESSFSGNRFLKALSEQVSVIEISDRRRGNAEVFIRF